VNARLVTLRAPIEGEVEAPASINAGTQFAAGDTVLRIVNRRAERARLDDLTRLIDQLQSERASIASRIADMTVMQADITSQLRTFQEGRLRQLKARSAEIVSELAVARANRDAAQKALARVEPIGELGQHSCRDAGTLPARCPGDRRDLYRDRASPGGAAGRAEGGRVGATSSAILTTTNLVPPSASTRSASA